MTLATPLWLIAAASVAVPILIHLFGRPRPKLRRFPSLMLLREAHAQRRSTTRLRRIIALILRCLALILLALVLAGPMSQWPPLAALGEPPGAPAIVLDRSPSMAARINGGTPLRRARDAAQMLVERAHGSRPFVIHRTGGSPQTLSPDDAAGLIADTAVTDGQAHLTAAIGSLFDREETVSRVFVLTDLQATGFDALPIAPDTPAEVIAVDTGTDLPGNSALTGLDASGGLHLRGRPLDLSINARTWGEGRGRVPLQVRCNDNDLTVGIDLLPDAPATSTIEIPAATAGPLTCTAALPEDAFSRDDRRVFATSVRDRLRVSIIGDANATRFIEAALDPWPEGDPRSVIDVTAAGSLADDSSPDAVVIASGSLSPTERDRIGALARDGIGALVFGNADRDVLDAVGFGDVQVGEPLTREEGAALADLATNRPPLGIFAQPGTGDLSEARFSHIPQVDVGPGGATPILARYDDGTPALVEGALHRARTLLLATSPDDAWGDLVRIPEFVPLMHRLVTYLAAGTEPMILAGAPGEPTVGTVPHESRGLHVVTGEGSARPARVTDGYWRFSADAMGAYRLRSEEEDIAAFAVNLDTAESDPARLSEDQLARRLKPLDTHIVSADALEETLERLGPGSADVSSLVALLALLVLAVESVQSLQADGSANDE